ncbi:hypothetical protein HNQ93_002551 [Hymenobacter luteus]|uniref:Uncharacterized protein n=2 Tax=Hymenobacter TaxID=89966 RepID=A0A7W9WCT3_9BACT|nr:MULTISPECIES: hypothetical protein [Hymenobacter]MBB4601880.1 hypothetical protein [Hymenobacter latericoloratus]MBB6059691.1 hypothetical protein [Hymenobacter luteus]
MESILLIAEKAALLPAFKESIQKVFPCGVITDQPGLTGFAVQIKGANRLYVDYYGTSLSVILGWTEDELALIAHHFPAGFHLYNIHYRSLETIKKVIIEVAASQKILIDNDFGTFLTANSFVSMLMRNPHWDWRNDNPRV